MARGFGYQTYERTSYEWRSCWRRVPDIGPDGRRRIVSVPDTCFEPVEYTERRPVALDLNAEKQKLIAMQKKRAELAQSAQAGVAQCRIQYPDKPK